MTIAELERRSGLTRANIRFYEAEGLLRPARRENGCRDYSEEDLALLLRVRLLRELGLPLAEIRQLRGGDLALGAALDAHLARLGVELERAERSQAVCRDILGSGESFEALDAPRWLAELSARGPKPAEGFDSVPPLICPWRRFFARNLDLMLCTILPLAAAALLFRPNYQPQGFGFTVIRTLVTLAALFVAEPLLLHFWGTTPGKWLLGLSVESESGGRLSLGEAWGRTTGLICYGLGFYLPLVSLVTCAVSYQKHSSGRPLSWEAGSELRLRDRGRAAGVAGYICLCALLFFVAAWTLLDAQLPRHRGEMSAAEFCENYNSLAAMHGLHSDGKRLTTEGWIDINHSLTIGNLSDSEPEYVFTEEGGVLTRLELRIETGEDAIYISPPTSELQLAAMSLVWGREGMGALDLAERQELLRRIKAAGFSGFDFEAAGLRLFCEAEYAGEPTAFGLTAAEDGEPPCLKLVFRVTEAGM